jgi:hypothetical protein
MSYGSKVIQGPNPTKTNADFSYLSPRAEIFPCSIDQLPEASLAIDLLKLKTVSHFQTICLCDGMAPSLTKPKQ